MDKKGQSWILIMLIVMAIVIVAFSLSFVWMGAIKEKASTEVELSKEKISFGENIETTNDEIINQSSQANNFIKYCLGIAIVLFALGYFIKNIYKIHQIKRKK